MDKSYADIVLGYPSKPDELNQFFPPSDTEAPSPSHTPSPTGPMGLTLSWHRLSVWVKKVDESRSSWLSKKFKDEKILSKVSGIAEPGHIMAILGPSGAGKTTLLATISQRAKGNMRGQVLVNGKEISKDLMLRISGFVPQKDLVLETLTVLEHLQFMARLKMDRNTTKSQRNQIILSILSEMGLVSVKNNRISQLSGGEKKRLSMAVQLLTDPAILFCDEPTTGLDSYSAMAVVEQLKKLAVKGKTIICTIHQPASGLLDMFDQVYLLVAGGKMALFSDTDRAENYFNSLGIYCPPTYNLAEFLISNLALENDEESERRVENICKQYKNSKEYDELMRRLELEVAAGEKMDCFNVTSSSDSSDALSVLAGNELNQYVSVRKPSKFVQLGWLTWRSFVDLGRNPKTFLVRFSLYLFMALLISIPYGGLTIDQKGIQNLQGFLYLVIVETTFTFTYSVAHTFPAEIPLLLREIDAGLYTPDTYYVSKILTLIPRSIVEPTIYAVVTFFISGLFGGFYGFLRFCVPVIMASTAATAYGCLVSAVFKSISRASLLSVPYEQVALLFCGVFMALDDVPIQFAWVKYVSIFYYGLEFISIMQWTQIQDIPCSKDINVPCVKTGTAVLDYYGYKESNMIVDIIGLTSIYCIYHALGYIALLRRCKKPAAY